MTTPTSSLSSDQRRQLRARARTLKARHRIGKAGLNEHLQGVLERDFRRNDLVKVRLERCMMAQADELGQQLKERCSCHLIQRVGRVLVLYRGGLREQE
jgi:RNA-binding protein